MGVGNQNDQTYFENLPEIELVEIAKTNDAAMLLLITRMMPLVHEKASRYRDSKVERDDLIQEGLIGLMAAVRTFSLDQENAATFKTYAGVCINNRILSYIKAYFRQKNVPLNQYISLSAEENTLAISNDITRSVLNDPEEILMIQEELANVWNLGKTSLSSFEYNVFQLYLGGFSYEEIAKKVDTSAKSVDNALQRIRRKLRKMLNKNDD